MKTASEIIHSLNKWNAKQVFRQDMIKGHGDTLRSAMKRADPLKRVELFSKAMLN